MVPRCGDKCSSSLSLSWIHIFSRTPQFPVCLPCRPPTPLAKPCFVPLFPGCSLLTHALHSSSISATACEDAPRYLKSPLPIFSYVLPHMETQSNSSGSLAKCHLFCEGFGPSKGAFMSFKILLLLLFLNWDRERTLNLRFSQFFRILQ